MRKRDDEETLTPSPGPAADVRQAWSEDRVESLETRDAMGQLAVGGVAEPRTAWCLAEPRTLGYVAEGGTSYVLWTLEVKTSYVLRTSEVKIRFLRVALPDPVLR
jgi:hypothetical protein